MATYDRLSFEKALQLLKQQKNVVPVMVANDLRNYFVASFTKQGYAGKPWKEVKRRIHPRSQKDKAPILVQSGALRRDVLNSIRKATFNEIRLGVALPYAGLHNEGGTVTRGEGTHIMSFRRGKGGGLKLTKARTENQRKGVVSQAKVHHGASTVTVAARPFMKHNKQVEQLVIKRLQKEFKKIFG